jgi:hypothetical protein
MNGCLMGTFVCVIFAKSNDPVCIKLNLVKERFMKKLIILLVIGFAVWQFYIKDSTVVEESNAKAVSAFQNSGAMRTLAKAKELAHMQSTLKCDERTTCAQMTSTQEAVYFNRYCPNAQLSKDSHGVVCGQRFNN